LKQKTFFLICLAVAAFAVGCKPSNERSTAEQLDKLKTETKQAAQDLKDYTFAQKTEFTEKLKSQLAEINQDLDLLAAKIEKASDAAKAEAKPKLQALREKADELGKQLDEARNATEPTWENVKANSKKAFDEFKNGFNQARQWGSDKIAP
jgi:hypothetical protein